MIMDVLPFLAILKTSDDSSIGTDEDIKLIANGETFDFDYMNGKGFHTSLQQLGPVIGFHLSIQSRSNI